jgi:hypothetical protein
LNAITVWDQRIPAEQKEFYQIDYKKEWVEYYLTDMTRSLKGKNVKVFLRWEQMTHIGPYYSGKVPIGEIQLPNEYVNQAKRRSHRPAHLCALA